jgi:hypothetical protein
MDKLKQFAGGILAGLIVFLPAFIALLYKSGAL